MVYFTWWFGVRAWNSKKCMKGDGLVNFGIVGWSVYTSFLTLVYCFWCYGVGGLAKRGAISVLYLVFLFKVCLFRLCNLFRRFVYEG